jgi:hypothetical protein
MHSEPRHRGSGDPHCYGESVPAAKLDREGGECGKNARGRSLLGFECAAEPRASAGVRAEAERHRSSQCFYVGMISGLYAVGRRAAE